MLEVRGFVKRENVEGCDGRSVGGARIYRFCRLRTAQSIRVLRCISSLGLSALPQLSSIPPLPRWALHSLHGDRSQRADLQAVALTNVRTGAGALAAAILARGLGDWLRELQLIRRAGRAGVESTEELTGSRSRAIAAIVVAVALGGFRGARNGCWGGYLEGGWYIQECFGCGLDGGLYRAS